MSPGMTNPSDTRDSELAKPYVKRNQPGGPMDGGEVVITFRSDAEMQAILDLFDGVRRYARPDTTSTEEAVLPCDVQLPPATVLRKGVKLSTLHEALRVRGMHASPREGHVEVPVEPTHWAVSSPTGMHVGLWSDRMLARQVLEGYPPGYTITPFVALPHNQGETKP